MRAVLKVVCRSIERQINAGGDLEFILASYPRLTDGEKTEIREYFSGKAV